jgi:hypothetical protein
MSKLPLFHLSWLASLSQTEIFKTIFHSFFSSQNVTIDFKQSYKCNIKRAISKAISENIIW